jgi:hypothetical protein
LDTLSKISWENAGNNDNNNKNHLLIKQDGQPSLMNVIEEEEKENQDLFKER